MELHIVSTLSQLVIFVIDFMLDYDLVPNAVNLTEELSQDLKFPLERPLNGALTKVRIQATKQISISERCAIAITTRSHMLTNVDYVFSPQQFLDQGFALPTTSTR